MKNRQIKCPLDEGNGTRCPLAAMPVFAGVPKAAWEELRRKRTSNIYRKGNIIFYDGNRPLGMYFICSGRVKIVKYESGFHSNIARVAQAPDLLGDRAFFAGEPYRGSGEVMEESRICFIDGASFERLFLEAPGVARNLLSRLAVELGQAEERLLDLAFKTARERLAKYIIEKLPVSAGVPPPALSRRPAFSGQAGGGAGGRGAEPVAAQPKTAARERRAEGPAGWIKFSETRVELAKILDTTPEALCRILAEFKSKGWIAVDCCKLRVLDRNRLAQTAGISNKG